MIGKIKMKELHRNVKIGDPVFLDLEEDGFVERLNGVVTAVEYGIDHGALAVRIKTVMNDDEEWDAIFPCTANSFKPIQGVDGCGG